MASEKRRRGESEVKFITEELESTRLEILREEKILGKIKREDVTDLAYQGPSLPDGSVNFDCSCTGSLPFGPCGEMYRNAIRCMKTYEHLDDDLLAERCGLLNTWWRQCMDKSWRIYYPRAATAEQRQKSKS